MLEFNPAATIADLQQRAIEACSPALETITPSMRVDMREQLTHAVGEHTLHWETLLQITEGVEYPAPPALQAEIRWRFERMSALVKAYDEAMDWLQEFDEAWLEDYADLRERRRREDEDGEETSALQLDQIIRRAMGDRS